LKLMRKLLFFSKFADGNLGAACTDTELPLA